MSRYPEPTGKGGDLLCGNLLYVEGPGETQEGLRTHSPTTTVRS